MELHQLEHLIRAACDITNRYELVIVGSQSILGSVDRPPSECLLSMEADVYPLGAEELSDLIDGAIGEGSLFHQTYGYYAQGVDSTTAILPEGWLDRVVRLQSGNTNGRVGYCLEVTDLFVAKCAAGRERDKHYCAALLRANLVNTADASKRIEMLPVDDMQKQAVRAFLNVVHQEAKSVPEIASRLFPGATIKGNKSDMNPK